MVPEANLEDTGTGLVPKSAGWFVLNARDARWFDKPGQGHSVPLTGNDEYEVENFFPMLGMSIRVVGPGEPSTTYHWEIEQKDFLVLAGEGLLIVEGQERRVKQWDFVHCPPETRHAFVGAGDGPCVLLCASSRQFQKDGPWGVLLRGRKGRPAQRGLARGHAGRRHCLRALPTVARDALSGRAAAGLARRGVEVDGVGLDRPSGPPRRGLVGPVQVRVRDHLVRWRRAPGCLVLRRMRVADE